MSHALRGLLLCSLVALLGRCAGAAGDSASDAASDIASTSSLEEAHTPDATGSPATASPANSAADLQNASCSERERALSQQISTSFANGDLSCEVDGDCSFSSPEFSCYHGCSGWLVSRAGRATTQAAVERDMAPFCSALAGCPVGIPGCIGDRRIAECGDGTCRIFDDAAFSCDQLGQQAILQQTPLLDAAERSCTTDSDCALFYEPPGCVYDCPLLASVVRGVTASSVAALQVAVQRAGSKYCNAWAWRCPLPTEFLACPVPDGEPRATCVAGVCDVRYVMAP